MGANIGSRVYWPGSGIYCLDPELLTIGDDVVFGSRSQLFTTDRMGSGRITVGDGGKHEIPKLTTDTDCIISHDR